MLVGISVSGTYILQSSKQMQKKLKNSYNYYVKLLLGLIGVYLNFLTQYLTKKSVVLLITLREQI